MEREKKIQAIIDWFKDNEETFNDCIESLDSYNGYLGDDRYYDMDELNEFYNGTEPIEILYRTFYGGDDDTMDERGNRGEFNPNRAYFHYNGYGNLCSTDYKDYSDHLDHYAVESMAENRADIWDIDNDDELKELFDALENDDDEQEDC